jgi:hypothetical protein
VEARWTDARKLATDSRNKRRAAAGGAEEEDSVTVAFVAALESFCTQPSPSQHATAPLRHVYTTETEYTL